MILSLILDSWQRPLSYRNQPIDLLHKSVDWFLYDNDLRHERVNRFSFSLVALIDTTGAFKFSRQWQQNFSITDNFMKGAIWSLLCRESSINNIQWVTAIALRPFVFKVIFFIVEKFANFFSEISYSDHGSKFP